MANAKSHKDVEFYAIGPGGKEVYFKTFDEAAAFVARMALTDGRWHNLGILVHSEAGPSGGAVSLRSSPIAPIPTPACSSSSR